MKVLLPLIGSGLVAAVAWFWWQSEHDAAVQTRGTATPSTVKSDHSSSVTGSSESSPFAVDPATAASPETFVAQQSAADADQADSGESSVDTKVSSASSEAAMDVAAIAQSNLSDEEHRVIVDLLKNNPALLQQLIDEFRQETNPERLARLARVLGEVGGDAVILLGSELVFSGDNESRQLGLALLRDVQPGNEQARDIVSSMLSSAIDPDTLVGALSALAQPGDVDAQASAFLAEQVADLTRHESPAVRGISLSILSRWSDDARYNPVYVQALNDNEERVREAAAYALLGHQGNDPVVITALFNTLNNVNEEKSVRRATVMALRRSDLTPEQQAEVDALERQLDTRPR